MATLPSRLLAYAKVSIALCVDLFTILWSDHLLVIAGFILGIRGRFCWPRRMENVNDLARLVNSSMWRMVAAATERTQRSRTNTELPGDLETVTCRVHISTCWEGGENLGGYRRLLPFPI